MLQLTTLEKITPADAVSDACRARIAGDGSEFLGGFGAETFVGVDNEEPEVLVFDFTNTPGTMAGLVATKSDFRVLIRPLNHPRTSRRSNRNRAIRAERVIDDNIIAPSHRVETSRQVSLFIFRKYEDRHAPRLHTKTSEFNGYQQENAVFLQRLNPVADRFEPLESIWHKALHDDEGFDLGKEPPPPLLSPGLQHLPHRSSPAPSCRGNIKCKHLGRSWAQQQSSCHRRCAVRRHYPNDPAGFLWRHSLDPR